MKLPILNIEGSKKDTIEVSDKIVSEIAMARITETNYQFLSSSGADIEQDFLIIGSALVRSPK